MSYTDFSFLKYWHILRIALSIRTSTTKLDPLHGGCLRPQWYTVSLSFSLVNYRVPYLTLPLILYVYELLFVVRALRALIAYTEDGRSLR